MLWISGSRSRYCFSYVSIVIRVRLGSFWIVTHLRCVIPRLRTRSSSTSANFCGSSVPPCQVMLISVPVLCANWTVRMKDCILSGSVNAAEVKKIRENCGCSARIFCSMSTTFWSVTPAARLSAA